MDAKMDVDIVPLAVALFLLLSPLVFCAPNRYDIDTINIEDGEQDVAIELEDQQTDISINQHMYNVYQDKNSSSGEANDEDKGRISEDNYSSLVKHYYDLAQQALNDVINPNGTGLQIVNDQINGTVTGDKNGDVLGHGDIMFRPGEKEAVFGRTASNTDNSNQSADTTIDNNQSSDATIYTSKRWPISVPYVLENSLGQSAKTAIAKAIVEYNIKTCVRIVPRTSEVDYLSFYRGEGCWSYVGRSGGKQRISIGSGCEYKSTAVHEIMHALGFFHEQSRPDRDNYVTINYENIESEDKIHNFDKQLAKDVTYLGYGYDYHSVMHYGRTAFGKWYTYTVGWWMTKRKRSARKETITPKISTTLGQCLTCGLSRIDAAQLNAMYCSGTKHTVDENELIVELKRQMLTYSSETNSVFRYTLLNYLKARYPRYYWTVSSYNGVNGYATHAFIGHCGHVWRYYNKNIVACYALKNSQVPSESKRNEIANAVVASVTRKSCDAKWARDTAYAKAISYNFPISMIHNVRWGSGLRTTWHGFTKFFNYVCQRTCTRAFWLIKGKCTDHKSSLVIMFGSS